MFMSKEEEQVCCICGKKISGKENHPWSLKKEGRCCDECNKEVIEAKIAILRNRKNNGFVVDKSFLLCFVKIYHCGIFK